MPYHAVPKFLDIDVGMLVLFDVSGCLETIMTKQFGFFCDIVYISVSYTHLTLPTNREV